MVFCVRVREPRSAAGRRWNRAMDVLSPVVVFTPIVLKLTGVIDWSWWWVLSPMWISPILLTLVLIGGVIVLRIHAKRQVCREMNRVAAEILRRVAAEADNQGASNET